jgi:hypothetical protein
VLLACLVLSAQAAAAEDPQYDDPGHQAGSGSVMVAFQTIDVSKFDTGAQEVDIGTVSTQDLYVEMEYALSDRWTVKAGLPYIRKKYDGPARHDPLALVPPRPEVPFIDDGRYNGGLQDFLVGATYHWLQDPLIVEPFVDVFIPSHSYPHFGQAAIGQNRWKTELGVDLVKLMPFSNWYYRLGVGYTFVQKTLGVNVNHYRLLGEVGYYFRPELSANIFLQYKKGQGNSGLDFPPDARTDERWYQHDRTLRHSYLNGGIGADWFFNDRYQLSGWAFTTIQGDSVHVVDLATSISLTRYF